MILALRNANMRNVVILALTLTLAFGILAKCKSPYRTWEWERTATYPVAAIR